MIGIDGLACHASVNTSTDTRNSAACPASSCAAADACSPSRGDLVDARRHALHRADLFLDHVPRIAHEAALNALLMVATLIRAARSIRCNARLVRALRGDLVCSFVEQCCSRAIDTRHRMVTSGRVVTSELEVSRPVR